ncbi:SAM-dependent DNA methyltransferase [bacterium]|nr:MAG: SAM-dependent DNA methyltransferase [bacterium]
MAKTAPRDFRKTLEKIQSGSHRSGIEVIRCFGIMAACALSFGTREAQYLEEVGRWEKDEVHSFAQAFVEYCDELTTSGSPFEDRLGPLLMDRRANGDRQWRGEYHTPWSLCQMMARMTLPEPPEDRPLEVLEPAAGTGAMILAIAEALKEKGFGLLQMRATLVEIDADACRLAYVQLTINGIPCRVIHGNSISQAVWDEWINPHWHDSAEKYSFRRMCHGVRRALELEDASQPAPPIAESEHVGDLPAVEVLKLAAAQPSLFDLEASVA